MVPGNHRATVLNLKSVSSLSLSSSFSTSLSSRWDCSAAEETSGSYSQSQGHTKVCEARSCPFWTCTGSLPGYFEAKHRPVQQLCSVGGVTKSPSSWIFSFILGLETRTFLSHAIILVKYYAYSLWYQRTLQRCQTNNFCLKASSPTYCYCF